MGFLVPELNAYPNWLKNRLFNLRNITQSLFEEQLFPSLGQGFLACFLHLTVLQSIFVLYGDGKGSLDWHLLGIVENRLRLLCEGANDCQFLKRMAELHQIDLSRFDIKLTGRTSHIKFGIQLIDALQAQEILTSAFSELKKKVRYAMY